MISVTVLTKDNERTIRRCLESVQNFSEVIVLDSGSTDKTLDIAQTFPNVKIVQTPFIGFGPLHNLAAQKATHDWILSLDADEVFQAALGQDLDPTCIYSFPFHNYFNGKWIKWCGWYPDRHVRLYNKTATRFSDAQVHEKILQGSLTEIKFSTPILHYSYETIDDFLRKMQNYSTLFSEQNNAKHSSLFKALAHTLSALFN
ncbi:MAG: glycosyltransferase family 2 protein, partial [Chlamydiia bacterium]|nr:glycosyltransferase family 2 protein [Chlamydiia bacterium]